MPSERIGFAVGSFFCRFIPESDSEEVFLLDDPSLDGDELSRTVDNVVNLISDYVGQHIDLEGAPFASWLLARLWYLTDGAVRVGLNVNAQGDGFADGGHYMGAALIEDKPDHAIAVLWIEGMDFYTQVVLTSCSIHISPEHVVQSLAQVLQADPTKIAPCRIAIADPEHQGFIHEFGWDGKTFLGVDKL